MSESFTSLLADENEAKSIWDTDIPLQNETNFEEDIQNLSFDYCEFNKRGGVLDEREHLFRESKFDGSEDKSSQFWKNAHYQYGINYNIMSKDAIYSDRYPHEKVENVEMANYCRKLYECKEETESLLSPQKSPRLKFGSRCDLELTEYDWWLQTNVEDLNNLTILDLQSTICAALNSKKALVWLIGVDQSCIVAGVSLDRKQRDSFRQCCDFATSHEFLPALDPTLVSLRFIPVSHPNNRELYVIEISVPQTVDTIYQLSHGRIYCVEDDRPRLLETFNDAYQILLSNSETKYTCPYHEERSTSSPFYLGVLAGVVLTVLLIGAYTR